MPYARNPETSLSLLAHLKEGRRPDDIWPDFVDRYGSALYAWCLRWGASPTDAEDIAQQTLLSVFLNIDRFEHGGRGTFRAWLRTIARNAWLRVVERSVNAVNAESRYATARTAKLAMCRGTARDDLIRRFDALACEELKSLAHDRVRMRVRHETWQAYWMCDHDRMPGKDIAESLGMSLKAVHLAALRVRRMLAEELRKLDDDWNVTD